MKKNYTNRLKVLALSLLATAFLWAVPVHAGMELQKADGKIVDLDDYRGDGKWLLVMLWATTCHICEVQKPEISAFHDKHKDLDAHVLGVAIDGMSELAAIQENLQDNKISFPTLIGDISIVASHYLHMTEESFRGTPTYLLFDPQGELVGNNPGPLSTGAIEKFIARKSG